MIRIFKTVRALCATILAVTILLAGCGSKSSSHVSGINPAALLADIVKSVQQPVTRALDGWDWDSFINGTNGFGSLLVNFRYTLDMQKVTYQSKGADGKVHSMTGLLILPSSIIGGKPSVPILMFQHGTEVYRPFSPSQYLANQDSPADYPEVMVAAAIAATGYAVAMVDYEGMGDNTDPQPHVVGATLAQQVIDLLRASRDIIDGTAGNGKSPCTWNSQLFLMGYSEGGYVTMVATRELQLSNAGEFTVTASAPLSGPHDLSGVMRGILLSDSTFKSPYFAPMFITSYNYAYGGQTPLFIFSPDVAMQNKPIAYNTILPPLFDGNSPSDKISEAMGMNFTTPTFIVMKSTLTQPFLDQLALVTSPLVAFLKLNDSYRLPGQLDSAWVPTVPMRMIHHKKDDLVPYENSQVAFDAFIAAGAKNVELVEETVTINISSDSVKTVHFAAAFPELIDGWKWIDSFKR